MLQLNYYATRFDNGILCTILRLLQQFLIDKRPWVEGGRDLRVFLARTILGLASGPLLEDLVGLRVNENVADTCREIVSKCVMSQTTSQFGIGQCEKEYLKKRK